MIAVSIAVSLFSTSICPKIFSNTEGKILSEWHDHVYVCLSGNKV